jgi:hydrogenase nickel incorporation protein HypA/HybF
MHEVGIAAELLGLAEAEAEKRGAGRVTGVGVRVGALSGVVGEALEFAFGALREEKSETAGARLEVEYVAVRARCVGCGVDDEPGSDLVLWCARCGGEMDIMQGRELDLMWVELDDSEQDPCKESP